MIRTLFLPAALRRQLLDEAAKAAPQECCGLIEGHGGEQPGATALHPTPNRATRQDRFEIDPAAHLALQRSLRGTGRSVIGCYHSHPTGKPEPSPHDLAGAGEEDFLWLIATPKALAAFTFSAGAFHRLTLLDPPDTRAL